MPWFHSSMFSRGAFTIVFIPYHYRANTFSFIVSSSSRNFTVLTGQLVFNLVGCVIESIYRTDEHVIRDVVQMPSVFQPWPSHRNMVSSTFSFRFYKQFHPCKVFLLPWVERGKQLQPVGVWIYDYLNRFAVFSRSLIACVLHRKT